MNASCQCGAVSFKTPLPKPLALYICHCAECRRQTGSAFGASAIFPRFQFPDAELLSCYVRPTAEGSNLHCYFCKRCGTRLIHTTPGRNVVSIKGGCIDGLDWKTAIHIWTKSAMVPIPEGSVSAESEESVYTDYGESQEMLDQPTDLRGSGGCPLNA
ncbi:glutathione-dependent formaldehyde-activating [Cercophora scortea]|uniref:Glutathione-dependent formaldehyde-activating n=1 Tax=Cercophora scortea TaxID=314031 RepID=A0AAE0J5E3_9PEZI|nr:glutathione-dependent formaldehyde-activating [Cercophora scortea]